MDPEYFRADDLITLTPGEWQELVASIQNLVQANNALLQTVSELMTQRNEAFSHQAPMQQAPMQQAPPPKSDPYDLRALNHLLNETP
jgi:hypothetical protein